jgi:uncharacterized repeat protein (TIGR01451 family)
MTEQEDTRQKSRRDLLLVLLMLPLGVLCMFVAGQAAIRLAPTWVLNADMGSYLDPNANFAARGDQPFIEPLNANILTQPAWKNFLTPGAIFPTRVPVTKSPISPSSTPPPPPVINTPGDKPEPTATLIGPIVFPTSGGPRLADLMIEKSDNSHTYTPGTSIQYTILVTNRGPNDAPNFNVLDNIPAVITGLSVNCVPVYRCGTNTSNGHNISFTGANLNYSGVNQITITISGTVASAATGDLSNTASVVVPNGVRYQDPDPTNNVVTDTDTQLSVYELAITKTDGVDTYMATTPINYTIVVSNSGPSDALGISVVDNIPPQIAFWTWACTTVTNASGCNGTTNSTSNFTDTVNIRLGGSIEYSVTAIPAVLSPNPQNLTNTANIVLPVGPNFVDPNLTNNTATDIDIPYIDLQITKNDGSATYAANGIVTYTIIVTNNSTFDVTGITISDPKPARVTDWSWSCAGGGCTPVTNSNTNFTDTINLTAGSNLTYTVIANISGNANPGNLTNTATVNVPAGLVEAIPADNSATDVDAPNIDLQITKDDGAVTYTPGGTLNYTVTVTNNSAFNLTGLTVTDNRPALIDPTAWIWTCAPAPSSPSASCTPGPSNININDAAVNLPAGTSVIYTINATVRANAVGTLDNTATVSAPTGLTDAVPGNNTATDSDVSSVGEPDIGLPDGNVYTIPDNSSVTFFMSQPIVANGDAAADFVFYEMPMAPGIDLDQIVIEISSDGANWLPVFYWGNTTPDTNTNVDNVNIPNIAAACPTETDNCPIASGDLYNNTGITIDVDNSPLSPVPQGNYYWIRFTEPGLGSTDGTHVDAIEMLP